MISYWITEATSSEFFIYVDDDKLLYDFLSTLPTILLLIEYPFNMIPFDWPQLIFVELLFSVYMLINFMALTFSEGEENIYNAFEWYLDPGLAFVDLLACYAGLAIIFLIFWAITQKWKLPRFEDRYDRRYTDMPTSLVNIHDPESHSKNTHSS